MHNCRGWIKDIPSPLDYRINHPKVADLTDKIFRIADDIELSATSLRGGCSPIENQEQLGSCTANAAAGALEYLQRAWYGEYLDMSRLYIYLRTRELSNPDLVLKGYAIGDTGASIRSTIAAIVTCGAPPEKYWPYKGYNTTDEYGIPRFEQEPPNIATALARKFEGIHYVRLESLAHIKSFLRAGFPVIFGFAVFASIDEADNGMIPYPSSNDKLQGGHAVLAIGYDNNNKVLEIRNSWGTSWGDNGYGWLPFDYIENDLAGDFWVLLSAGYVKGLLS